MTADFMVWAAESRSFIAELSSGLLNQYENSFVAVDITFNGLGIRVKQQFVGVASEAVHRVIGTVDAVAVTLARMEAGNVVMPYVRVPFGHFDACFHIVLVEQA